MCITKIKMINCLCLLKNIIFENLIDYWGSKPPITQNISNSYFLYIFCARLSTAIIVLDWHTQKKCWVELQRHFTHCKASPSFCNWLTGRWPEFQSWPLNFLVAVHTLLIKVSLRDLAAIKSSDDEISFSSEQTIFGWHWHFILAAPQLLKGRGPGEISYLRLGS